MHNLKIYSKRTKGQMVSVMNLIIAFCIVLVVGLFAFELTRYLLARDELKTNVEAAALSCQTTLASSGDPTNATNQTTAESTGLQLFKQNSILGQPMSSANLAPAANSADTAPDLPPGQAQLSFQFLDPLTRLPVNASGAGVNGAALSSAAAGTLIQATGSYCYSPAFGQFIGMSNAQFIFSVSALAGIPKIDLMVLLDISGGMDDDTSVSLFQRYEGPTGTNWMIPPAPGGSNGSAQGSLNGVFCPIAGDPNAELPNATQPLRLEKIPNSTCEEYSEATSTPPSIGLGGAGSGSPPGNYCIGNGGNNGGGNGPVSFNNEPNSKHIAKVNDKHKHFKAVEIASARTHTRAHKKSNNLLSSNMLSSNINIGSQNILTKSNNSRLNDPGLLEISQKISGKQAKQAKNNAIDKRLISQLDDKFSKISFKPNFDIFPTVYGGGNNTNSTTVQTVGTGNNPPIPPTYAGTDGMQYVGLSHMPASGGGSGPDTNTLMPSISGNNCVNGVSTVTGYGSAAPNVFTGIVVNGVVGASNPNIPGMTINSLAAAIEAGAGDIESPQLATQAGIDTAALGITPQAGWYALYYTAARQFLQPMMSIWNSLTGFINEMSIISDIHYGFIAFNDNIGTSATSISGPINNVSSLYNFTTPNPDGSSSINSTYPLPNIPLSSTNSNQANIINTIPSLSVWGNRNVTQALTAAAAQLQANGRPGANQAILLLTCGAPSGSDTAAAAIAEAATIGQSGIPVYVICDSLNASYDTLNDAAYTDAGGTATGGVAGASGHGAKYFRIDYGDPTTNQNQMVSIFGNIARRIVSIMPSS